MHRLLVWATVAAAPAALALETALRWYVLPREFELVREALSPTLTPLNWVLVAATWICALVATRLARRALTGHRPRQSPTRRRTSTFLWASSVPQLPAIVATLATLFGGALLPTILSIAIASLSIVFLGKMDVAKNQPR